MARSKSSKQWMQEHFDDEYVKKAQSMGYRSRSTFKLVEIQEKDKIIKPGMNVIDLGLPQKSCPTFSLPPLKRGYQMNALQTFLVRSDS